MNINSTDSFCSNAMFPNRVSLQVSEEMERPSVGNQFEQKMKLDQVGSDKNMTIVSKHTHTEKKIKELENLANDDFDYL